MSRYAALLRGINVGGNNLIKMTALKACFERAGFTDVATNIQSGNLVFTSDAKGSAPLTRRIEEALASTFAYQASVVLRSQKELERIVERAPSGFGARPANYRYDVIFLKAPVTSAAAMKSVLTREGVDEVHAETGVLYFSRLIAKATRSQLGRIVSTPVYKSMTIRNWNTTTALLKMMHR